MTREQAYEKLSAIGQEHLLRFCDELSEEEKRKLLSQIETTDFSVLENLSHPEDLSGKGKIQPIEGLKIRDIEKRKEEFLLVGREAVRRGKVAAVLLAGGQGTRLGSSAPKGCFDVGVTKPLYIFEQQIKNLLEATLDCGAYVPLYIMTSDKNNAETIAFLKEHDYFGYPEEYVKFFVQDMAPAVDENGKVYLESKSSIALSPNGNGGWFSSMIRAGLVEDMLNRGVEWVNCYSVDNVLQRIADPAFVGATIVSSMNSGAKVVCKTNPHEKVGVLCLEDGHPNIIEYYELTEEMANQRDENGELAYIYGVILNYLFSLKQLVKIQNERIPTHIVSKKVSYIDEKGETVVPEKENGRKFETLILDMVKLMETCLPYEVVREKEFAPVKNKTGVDSVDTAREYLKKNGVEL